MRKRVLFLFSIIVLNFLIFLSLELLSRIIYYKPRELPDSLNIHLEDDPLLFWSLKSNYHNSNNYRVPYELRFDTNSFGLRSTEITKQKKENTLRILCIGDSITFGWGLKDEKTYPRQLEVLLREKLTDKNVEVINAGVPGYTSFIGKLYLETMGIGLNPDVVIFSFGINDSYKDFISDFLNYQKKQSIFFKLNSFFERSSLYSLFQKLLVPIIRKYPQKEVTKVYRVSLDEFKLNILNAYHFCLKHGIKFILLNEKVPGTIEELRKYLDSDTAEIYSREMSRIAKNNQIPFVDVLEFFNNYIKSNGDKHEYSLHDRSESQGDFIHEDNADKMGHFQIFRTPVNPEFAHLFIDPGHPNEVGQLLIATEVESVIEGLIQNP